MKRIFKLRELDCANCAAKMQTAIEKIDGVDACSVNFMTQRLTLEAADDQFENIVDQAVKICQKIEPDGEIVR